MGLESPVDVPDPADSYVSGVEANLRLFPRQHEIEVAAQTGRPVTVNGQTYDFTGLGDADYQAQYADQMAQSLLALQQEFGPEYVAQRLHELQRADPEGFSTRQHLFDAIRADLEHAGDRDRPTADLLQQTILDELNKGGELSETQSRNVSEHTLGGQVARGNWLGNAAATQEGENIAAASADQKSQRQQEALAFLTSGVSPADVDYRSEEQALSNVGSFLSGTTPSAQFGQLSGAQNQIVPWNPGQPAAGTDPNAGAAGINFANQLYQGQTALAASTVNPWTAGLAGGANGLAVWAAGQRPPPAPVAYNFHP